MLQLQRTVGNQAVSRLLAGIVQRKLSKAGDKLDAVIQRFTVEETVHYAQSRDEAHSKAKSALLEADSDFTVSNKIYNKHKNKKHGGKCVTSFPTSTGQYLVTVTYADLKREMLKYDTAFLSKDPANAPEKTAISYSPTSTVIDVS